VIVKISEPVNEVVMQLEEEPEVPQISELEAMLSG
jgi:hypothetical protein